MLVIPGFLLLQKQQFLLLHARDQILHDTAKFTQVVYRPLPLWETVSFMKASNFSSSISEQNSARVLLHRWGWTVFFRLNGKFLRIYPWSFMFPVRSLLYHRCVSFARDSLLRRIIRYVPFLTVPAIHTNGNVLLVLTESKLPRIQ